MKFCSQCGEKVEQRIPQGDDRLRAVCAACGIIHYSNPKIVVGCIAVWEDKVLLCNRAIQPRKGYWTLPAGFMENGETTAEGALRETREEANAHVENEYLYRLFNLPQINQVYMFFIGDLAEAVYSAGAESLAVDLFTEDEIPWNELAFPVMGQTLKDFFRDRKDNAFEVRISDMVWPNKPI